MSLRHAVEKRKIFSERHWALRQLFGTRQTVRAILLLQGRDLFCVVMAEKLDDDFDERLVDCVHSFPVLWEMKRNCYKDKVAKDNAWKTISDILNHSGKYISFPYECYF